MARALTSSYCFPNTAAIRQLRLATVKLFRAAAFLSSADALANLSQIYCPFSTLLPAQQIAEYLQFST